MIGFPQAQASEFHGVCRKTILDLHISELLWIIGFNLLLFEDVIQTSTEFSYIDELMTLLLFSAALKTVAAKQRASIMNSCASAAILLMLAVACLGLLGNIVWAIQAQAVPILIDLFTCIKFPIAVISACVVFSKSTDTIFKVIETEAKLVVIILLMFGVANLFVDFGMGGESRYGLRSFVGVFSHPTYLVSACVGLSTILLVNWRKNLPWILMALFVVALSLRTKGFVFAALVLVLVILFSRSGRLSITYIVVCVGLALLIGYDQFISYFGTDGYARSELLGTSFIIASDYAPLGSGFATYGSAITTDPAYYSPLYYRYGLSTVHGLTLGNTSFMSDTFWPIVLGQFGWIGLTCYIGMLMALFFFVLRLNGAAKLAIICCWLYLLISSTSESAFFNPMAIYIAVCMGLTAIKTKDQQLKETSSKLVET